MFQSKINSKSISKHIRKNCQYLLEKVRDLPSLHIRGLGYTFNCVDEEIDNGLWYRFPSKVWGLLEGSSLQVSGIIEQMGPLNEQKVLVKFILVHIPHSKMPNLNFQLLCIAMCRLEQDFFCILKSRQSLDITDKFSLPGWLQNQNLLRIGGVVLFPSQPRGY